ncbi:MAG TPA: GTPase domain-containing protein [Gemmataceae bacterium]|nr:GTPase domain-containing protein [Gemmataceae bacterium]
MEPYGSRALTTQLADDLGWLEQHCRQHAEQSVHTGQLRLAAALARNCVGPFLDDQPAAPIHVGVVGGAGAGKSTVANMLSGAAAAEANPQAGFTRHPIAYTSVNGPLTWAGHAGFLGNLQLLPKPGPASIDADVYQVRRVSSEGAAGLPPDFVIWDCPDMTTWAATGYVSRLLEIAGLADVLVYVASDERYNDAVPTQFLDLLLQTGKPVIAVLMKMREADAPALLEHFRKDVLAKLRGRVLSVLAVPFLSKAELADPARMAGRYRIPLLNQVAVLGRPAATARLRSVAGAANYLLHTHQALLAVARRDVAALQTWRDLVLTGRAEFDLRYRREYLTSSKFQHFDEALVRLIDLLEMPGIGKILSVPLWVARTPYRLLKGLVVKALTRPEAPPLPEQPVLAEALAGWLDLLHKEAARRADAHPLWAHVEKGFASGLAEGARERFEQGFRGYQLALASEVDHTARAIYEELEKKPILLNSLRGSKLALDVAALAGAVVTAGHTWALDFLLVPLATAVTQQLVELLGKQYVDNQREVARERQQALMAEHISGPLAEWLIEWPATGGSAFERLQLALRRLPESIRQLHQVVNDRLAAPAGR